MSSRVSGFCCPLCDFVDESEYVFQLHFEAIHPPGDNSSSSHPPLSKSSRDDLGHDNKPENSSSNSDPGQYVECPDAACGESMLEIELQSHMDMHLAEKMTFDDNEAQSSGSKQTFREHRNQAENPGDSTSRHLTRKDRRRNGKTSQLSQSRETSPDRHTGVQGLRRLFSGSSSPRSQQKSFAGSESQIKRLGVSVLTYLSSVSLSNYRNLSLAPMPSRKECLTGFGDSWITEGRLPLTIELALTERLRKSYKSPMRRVRHCWSWPGYVNSISKWTRQYFVIQALSMFLKCLEKAASVVTEIFR